MTKARRFIFVPVTAMLIGILVTVCYMVRFPWTHQGDTVADVQLPVKKEEDKKISIKSISFAEGGESIKVELEGSPKEIWKTLHVRFDFYKMDKLGQRRSMAWDDMDMNSLGFLCDLNGARETFLLHNLPSFSELKVTATVGDLVETKTFENAVSSSKGDP